MKFLFYKADARLLALLRISIGLWFFIDMVSMVVSGYVQDAYIDAHVNFPFYGFEWVKPLPGPGMYLLFFMLSIASVFIILGYYSRWALLFFILGFGYVFLIDIVYTLNKFYLFLLLAFYLSMLPVDKNSSLTTKKFPQIRIDVIPYWMILVFQLQLAIIYIFSGIAKLNPDWLLHAQPLISFFTNRWPFKGLSPEMLELMAYGFSYGGVLFDLSIIFLVWNKKTRIFGQWWQTAFHLLNFVILHIGSLSIFMCLLTWLLFPTDWLKQKLKFFTHVKLEVLNYTSTYKKRLASIFSFFLLLHILIPLRHNISGNDVTWTEKGHRFSWRLMSRTKNGSNSVFMITDNVSGEEWKINFRDYLTWRQYNKMSAETDLIIYFAHFLQEEWKEKGYNDVKITARVNTRVNGKKPQLLIPEDLDLTKVSRSFLVDRVSLEYAR